MRQKIYGWVVGFVLLMAPMQGFSYTPTNKISPWQFGMMDLAKCEQLLKENYGGKQSLAAGAFATFLEEIRGALLTDPKIRLSFWNHLEPILKTLPPAPTPLTSGEFEMIFLNLVKSSANFGPFPSKLLWPEEMFTMLDGDYLGVYIHIPYLPLTEPTIITTMGSTTTVTGPDPTSESTGQIQPKDLGQKIFFFPANFVLYSLTRPPMEVYGTKMELADTIIHEFLHHVAYVLYVGRYLPEDFFETQTVSLVLSLPSGSSQNTYEHLWIYKAQEAIPTLLTSSVSWAAGELPARPATVAWHWLLHGNRSRL